MRARSARVRRAAGIARSLRPGGGASSSAAILGAAAEREAHERATYERLARYGGR